MSQVNPFLKMAYESEWKSGRKLNNSPLTVKSSCCQNSKKFHLDENPAKTYLFKVNNRNTRKMCEISSKFTVKAPKQRQWRRFGVFISNFEQIPHIVLVFSSLTFNKYMPVGNFSFKTRIVFLSIWVSPETIVI